MRLHFDRLTLSTIRFPWVFHVSQRFFFLRINRDRRLSASLSRLHAACDVFKLGVAVWMLFTFNALSVRLKAVTLQFEKCSNFRAANGEALRLQLVGQHIGALTSPS
jgi:hypothetical protein